MRHILLYASCVHGDCHTGCLPRGVSSAAESMKKSDSMPDCLTKCFITYSAMVERQILPWQIKSTFIMQFYFLSYKFKISYIPNYLIIYFVPLPLPSIAITPFSHISFSNFVVFDFPKGIYGAISLIGFSIVLLKSL